MCKKLLIMAAFIAWSNLARAANFSVVPAAITNDYVGKVVLTVTGFAAGKTNVIEKYLDVNGNGVIDANEPLVQSCTVVDGRVPAIGGVRNLNVPGDEDGATNGQIRVELFYPGFGTLDLTAGNYLLKLSDPAGSFAPIINAFQVKQKVYPQGVSGRITALGSGQSLANAMVVLCPPDSSPISGVLADANGNFTLYSQPGNYMVIPIKAGYVGDFDGGVTVLVNATASLNLALPAGDRTVSGKLQDAATGSGLPGMFMMAQTEANQFCGGFSDASGNYSFTVASGQWSIRPDSMAVPALGYVAVNDDWATNVNTAGGSVSGVNVRLDKANALIYGRLHDSQNNPVIGVEIWSDDENNLYDVGGKSFPTNANFCLGVLAGNWWVGPDDTGLATRNFVGQGTNVTISSNQAMQVDLVVRQVNAHLIGRVVDNTYAAVGSVSIFADDYQGTHIGTDTDGNGNFNLGVFGGTWNVNISYENSQPLGLITTNLTVTVTNGQALSNILYVVQRATAHLRGRLVDELGGAINNLNISVANSDYSLQLVTQTDANGYFDVGVLAGSWSLYPFRNEMASRGLMGPDLPAFTVVDGADQNNLLVVLRHTTATLKVWIRDNQTNPVPGVGIWMNSTVSGTNYSQYDWTDDAGYHEMPVFNGTWQVELSCGDLDSRGYVCVSDVWTNVAGADVVVTFIVQPSAPPQITTTLLPDGTNGLSFSAQLSAAGGVAPYYWSLAPYSDALPSGLTLNTNGLIAGTPPGPGTNYFYARVTDSLGNTADQLLCIKILAAPLQITTIACPDGTNGAPYSVQLSAAGGLPPYRWSLALGSASLPAGLSLSSTGVISGAPAGVGTNAFIVQAVDSASHTNTRLLILVVNLAAPRLSLACAANTVSIKWPTALAGFGVQQNTALSATNWTDVVQPCVTNGSNLEMTLPLNSGRRFFRLHKNL